MSLTVKILGDASGFTKAAAAVDKRIHALGKKIGSSLGSQFTKLAGSFAAIFAAGKAFSALEQTADWVDNLHDMALQTGESAAELLKLETAFSVMGVGIADASRVLSVFLNNLSEARQGNETVQKALNTLGFLAGDFKGKGPIESFEMLSEAIQKSKLDTQELTRVLGDILGTKVGMKMLRVFRDPATFEAISKEFEGAGQTIDKVGPKIAKLADEWEKAKTKMRLFWVGILGGVNMSDLVTKLGNVNWEKIGQSLGNAAAAIGAMVSQGKFGKLLGDFLKDLGDVFDAAAMQLTDSIVEGVTKALPGVKDVEAGTFKEKLRTNLPNGKFRTEQNIEDTLKSIDASSAETARVIKTISRDKGARFA